MSWCHSEEMILSSGASEMGVFGSKIGEHFEVIFLVGSSPGSICVRWVRRIADRVET